MTVFSAFIIGVIVGVVLTAAGFIWLNRNKPEQLDKAEDAARKYKGG